MEKTEPTAIGRRTGRVDNLRQSKALLPILITDTKPFHLSCPSRPPPSYVTERGRPVDAPPHYASRRQKRKNIDRPSTASQKTLVYQVAVTMVLVVVTWVESILRGNAGVGN